MLTTTQYLLSAPVGGTNGFEAHATDPDGDAVTLSWTFDDGTTATGEQVSKGWDVPGIHTGTVSRARRAAARAPVALTIGGKPLGTASFSLRADQTTTAYVRVSRLTAARLRKHRSLALAVTVAVRGADPASTTRTLTLRTR